MTVDDHMTRIVQADSEAAAVAYVKALPRRDRLALADLLYLDGVPSALAIAREARA
jgi:hypothetical protein